MSPNSPTSTNNTVRLAVGTPAFKHLVAMCLLYVGQGFLQGLCFTLVQLMMEVRPLSLIESAQLATTMITFSFKAFWAPLVDGIFPTLRLRRPTWILCMQVPLVICFVSMWHYGEQLFRDADWFGLLVTLIYTTSFLSATQDIAIDAWAVEGVPASLASYASTTQTLGLITGIGLTRLCGVLIGRGALSIEHFVAGLAVVYVSVLIGTCAYLATHTCSVALDMALANSGVTPGSAQPTIGGVLRELGVIVRTPWCRVLCLAFLLKGLASASPALFMVQAPTHLGVRPGLFSELGLVGMGVQIAVSTYTTYRLDTYNIVPAKQPALWYWSIVGIALVYTGEALTYLLIEDGQSTATVAALVALSIADQIVHAVAFTLSCSFASAAARRFPTCTATALTLFQSMSNAGGGLVTMAASRALATIIDSAAVAHVSVAFNVAEHKVAFAAVTGVFLTASAICLRYVVWPAIAEISRGISGMAAAISHRDS
jgi:hypothetical protein